MKKVIYPYNEILPKKTAHDIYIVHNCAALSQKGLTTTLLCGKGSLEKDALFKHYGIKVNYNFTIRRLPIIRKNFLPKITWNPYFFYFCQKFIRKQHPEFVICSVIKQAQYHFLRKLPQTKYIYEIHELHSYPNGMVNEKLFKKEKQVFDNADLLIVTTSVLKELLQHSPYNVRTPIEVIPLAVNSSPLDFPHQGMLKVGYVGQLYKGQGLDLFLKALARADDIQAEIVGGKFEEIKALKILCEELGIENRVYFHGFVPPKQLPQIVKNFHACIAPFENSGRMPYVAHTKLYEYAHWGRPIIAPNLSVVKDHLSKGVLYFNPEDIDSLSTALNSLKDLSLLKKLRDEILTYSGQFSWENRSLSYMKILDKYFT